MNEITINVENVKKAFHDAGNNEEIQNLLINLFGKENVEPEHLKDVTERIKTFEDAYNELGSDHPFCQAWDSIYQGDDEHDCDDIKDVIAYHKLRIIVAALNEGWKPEFKENEHRYYLYFYFYTKEEYLSFFEDKNSVQAFAHEYYYGNVNGSMVYAYALDATSDSKLNNSSRLAYKNYNLAIYAGKQFIDIYMNLLF